MTKEEKILWILSIVIFLAPVIALAVWLKWTVGTTLSFMAIVFILLFIRG